MYYEKWKTEKEIPEKEKSVDREKKWKLLSEDSFVDSEDKLILLEN